MVERCKGGEFIIGRTALGGVGPSWWKGCEVVAAATTVDVGLAISTVPYPRGETCCLELPLGDGVGVGVGVGDFLEKSAA